MEEVVRGLQDAVVNVFTATSYGNVHNEVEMVVITREHTLF